MLDRVPEFLSCRRNWGPHPPPLASECVSTWVLGGTHTRLQGGEWGDPIQTTGQKLWYSIWYNSFTCSTYFARSSFMEFGMLTLTNCRDVATVVEKVGCYLVHYCTCTVRVYYNRFKARIFQTRV